MSITRPIRIDAHRSSLALDPVADHRLVRPGCPRHITLSKRDPDADTVQLIRQRNRAAARSGRHAFKGTGRILPAGGRMNYSLFGSTGNLIDWFEDESEARSALQMIVDREPESADDVALFVCDDVGEIIEGPIHAVPTSAA